MNRIIKFRAWYKFDESYAEEIGKPGEMLFSDEWGKNEEVQDKRTIVISGFYHDSGWSMKDVIPMQFTGLLDKNGKEIYEGDILSDDNGIIAYISFCIECFSYQYFYDNVCHSCDGNFQLLEYKSEDIKVIGNIYENPELLS